MDISQFKDHLRDFLVQIKVSAVAVFTTTVVLGARVLDAAIYCMLVTQEFSGDDPSDLYLEEREGQLRQAAEEKRRQQLTVPGIINPHDRPDDMQE